MTSKDLAKYEAQLAKLAAGYQNTEASSGGLTFFSTRSGILSYDGVAMKDNRVYAIVIDSVMENLYYKDKFDPEKPQGPACYAFGRKDDELKPHEEAPEPQSDVCASCDHNKWGSSPYGRGKACRNTRRVALLDAGPAETELNEDPKHYKDAVPGLIKLPVTSVKGYSNFVREVATGMNLPPFAIYTEVKCVPDPKTQFRIVFTPIKKVPSELIPVLLERNEEIGKQLVFPYAKFED